MILDTESHHGDRLSGSRLVCMATTWREQSRDILRSELALAATDIFAVEGFDEVTVDDLVQRLGISRATFFRYFGSKDEAVLTTLDLFGDDYAALLEAVGEGDVVEGETLWQLIARVLRRVVALSDVDTSRMRGIVRAVDIDIYVKGRKARDILRAVIGDPRVWYVIHKSVICYRK